jgi:arginine exporter protein ArgO
MSSSTGGVRRGVDAGSRLRTAARMVGIVFLLVGVAGFIPGITTNYDQLEFAGHESGALLLGIFEVSVLHNIVHLLFGVAGLLLSRTASAARTYLIGGGIIYLLLWIYGLLIDHESTANFVPVNDADNWLHLVLGIGMIGLGVVLSPRRAVTAR